MKKYLSVYRILFVLNWNAFLEYRTSLGLNVLSRLLFTTYHVATIFLLTNVVPSVFGWSRYELLLLASNYSVFVGLFHMIVSRSMTALVDEIYLGKLDFLLIKPIDSQFSTTFRQINFVDAIRVIIAAILSGYFLQKLGIAITLSSLLLYGVAMIMGLSILYSVWLSVISLVIFNPRLSNLVDLLFHVAEIGRFPGDMYKRMSVFLFSFVFPLTLILLPSTRILLHQFTWTLALELGLACTILNLLARSVWRFALRSYTSASS